MSHFDKKFQNNYVKILKIIKIEQDDTVDSDTDTIPLESDPETEGLIF